MGRAATLDQQESLIDKPLDDATLEAALESRQAAKERRREVNAEFKVADENAKHELERFELAPGEVGRCGRFRIENKQVAPRSVSFETELAERLNIKLVD